MPFIRVCKNCDTKNRIPARHLADTGRCGKCKAALGPVDEPLEVDTEQFDELAREARVPVLVDFWAGWCGPCRIAAPEVERTAKELAGQAVVVKVDTEKYPQLALRYKVLGIPNFMVLHSGKVVIQQAGVVDHTQMESWLKSAATTTAS